MGSKNLTRLTAGAGTALLMNEPEIVRSGGIDTKELFDTIRRVMSNTTLYNEADLCMKDNEVSLSANKWYTEYRDTTLTVKLDEDTGVLTVAYKQYGKSESQHNANNKLTNAFKGLFKKTPEDVEFSNISYHIAPITTDIEEASTVLEFLCSRTAQFTGHGRKRIMEDMLEDIAYMRNLREMMRGGSPEPEVSP